MLRTSCSGLLILPVRQIIRLLLWTAYAHSCVLTAVSTASLSISA
jgi:hypothetical protein